MINVCKALSYIAASYNYHAHHAFVEVALAFNFENKTRLRKTRKNNRAKGCLQLEKETLGVVRVFSNFHIGHPMRTGCALTPTLTRKNIFQTPGVCV